MTIKNQTQLYNYPYLYASGCQVSVTSNTTVNVTPGQLRDSTNTFDIIVDPSIFVEGLTLTTAGVGVNALDTGTVQANAWYAVYVIYDQTQLNLPAGLLAASLNPIMPSANGVTYSAYRLIGWVRTDGSSHLLPCIITGNSNTRVNTWEDGISVVSAGAFTDLTLIECGSAIPPVDNSAVLLDVNFVPNAAGDSFFVKPDLASTTNNVSFSGSVAAVAQLGQIQTVAPFFDGIPSFYYQNSAASGSTTLYVRSFTYVI